MSSNLKVNTILPSTGTAIGIGTASGNVDVLGHIVGHNTPNISGINSVTATTFYGSGANLTSLPAANLTGTLPAISGANLTSLPAQVTLNNNADNRVITGGSGVNLYAESGFTYDGTTVQIPDRINCNTNGTYLKENQLSFNPTGTAYLDHYRTGQDIQIRMSTSSSLDTTGPTFKSNGNLAFASGKGIDFSATTDATGVTSELFDDYEIGVHLISVLGSGSNPSVNLSNNHKRLYYTKIGNMVYVTGELRWTINSHGSGDLRITLPFQSDSSTSCNSQGTAQTWNVNWAWRSETRDIFSEVSPGNSFLTFRLGGSGSLHEDFLQLGSTYQSTANSGYGVEYQVSLWYRTG